MRRLIAVPYPPKAPVPLIDIPIPSISGVAGGTTVINLTMTYTGPPTRVQFVVQWATSAAGPFQLVGTTVQTTIPHIGLTPGTTYYYRTAAIVTDGPTLPTRQSVWSAVASATTSAGSATIKHHPGHYAYSAQLIAPYRGNNWATIQGEIDFVFTSAAAAKTLGFGIYVNAAQCENNTLGTYDFSRIDQVRDYLASTYNKRLIVSITWVQYDHSTPVGCTPQYILNDAVTYGAGPGGGAGGGYWSVNANSASVTAYWRGNVGARIKAMGQALAQHQSAGQLASGIANYDSDPLFEAFTWIESGIGIDAGSDATTGNKSAAWESIGQAYASYFPHTTVLTQNNFFDSQANTAAVVTADYGNRLAMSGPDLDANFGTNLAGQSWGYQAYRGTGPGAGADLYQKMPCIVQVQNQIGLDYSADTVAGLANTAFNVLGASHIAWTVLTGGAGVPGDWNTYVAPVINSTPVPAGNQVCPLSYVNAGGCNSA